MESPIKRRKIISVQCSKRKRKLNLTTLNMKCIAAILKWLPIEDLYSVSCTCKALQKSAGLQYQQSYPNSLISIELMANKQILSQYDGKYDLHFSANIRNVTMTSYIFDQDPMQFQLFDYVKMNCCQNLKELNLYRLNCTSDIDYGASIKLQLRHLECLTFNGCIILDPYKQFIKYCPRLTHLRFYDKKFNANCSDSWMNHIYPTLNSFTFWGCDARKYSELLIFFRMNRTVKNINCMGIDVLELVLMHAKDLNNLVIHCEAAEDIETIHTLLMKSSTLGVFKRFEFVFHFTSEIDKIPKNVEHIRRLSKLTEFQGFHGLFTTDTILVDCVLKSLGNLRMFRILFVN